MKDLVLKNEVFEAKDFETAYSDYLVRNGEAPRIVPISEMDFTLVDLIPADTGIPDGMSFYIEVDSHVLEANDLFGDDDGTDFIFSGNIIKEEFWAFNAVFPEVLFDFGIREFKSFRRVSDSSIVPGDY